MGICVDELSSGYALGDGYENVPQIIKGQDTARQNTVRHVCVGFTVGSRADCGIWIILLYLEGYCFLYVPEE